MRLTKREILIEEASAEYEGVTGSLLCTRASACGWYRWQDFTRHKSPEERSAVRFMFAYLLLLVEGEEE